MTSRRTLCNVRGCNNNIKYNRHLSFFTLPKDEERRDIWLKLIGRPDLQQKRDLRPASHSICSDHFDPSMIIMIPKLKPEAIPTKNLPGTRNVANTSKHRSSDTSESETSDSDSSMPATVSDSNNSKQNIISTEMVDVLVESKPEKDSIETIHIKKEKDHAESEHIDKIKGDSVPIPVTIHVKVEKNPSDTEPIEKRNNDFVKIHIKEEEHDLDPETSSSLPLKPAGIFTKTITDTPSTSTCKATYEAESQAIAMDTSTQTNFSKIKKYKKMNKNTTTETLPVHVIEQKDSVTQSLDTSVLPSNTTAKRSIQNIIESEYKRRRV